MWADPSGMIASSLFSKSPQELRDAGITFGTAGNSSTGISINSITMGGVTYFSSGHVSGGGTWQSLSSGASISLSSGFSTPLGIIIPVPTQSGGNTIPWFIPGIPQSQLPQSARLPHNPVPNNFPIDFEAWNAFGNAISQQARSAWDWIRDSASGMLNRSTPTVQEELGRIAGGFGIGYCVQAANAMQEYLTKNGRNGNVIILQFPGGRLGSYIVSDSYMDGRIAISDTGMHRGIEYNRFIHCNVFPQGKPEHEWIISFIVASGNIPRVTRIPF